MNKFRGLLFQQKLLVLLGLSLLILAVGLLVTVWYSFHQAETQIEVEGYDILSRQTETFLSQQVQERARSLELQFNQLESVAIYGSEVLKKQGNKNFSSHMTIEYILKSLLQSLENSEAKIYFASPITGLNFYPHSNFQEKLSIQNESIFTYLPTLKEFKKSNRLAIWSQPHPSFFREDHEWMIDVFVPLHKHKPFESYIGISISLTDLITQFNQLHPTRGSYSFLIDEKQNLIAALPHARLELASPGKKTQDSLVQLKDTGDEELDRFFLEMSLGRAALTRVKIKGEEKYIASYPLKTMNWRLGIVVPVSTATAASIQLKGIVEIGMKNALVRMVFGAILILGIALLIGGLLIRQLLIPLHRVTGVSHNLAEGRFLERVKVTSNDEIGRMAQTFNRMADQIQALVSYLEQRARELENLNQSLEQKVLERTSKLQESSLELANSNKQLEQEIKERHQTEKALIIANEALHQLATIDGLTQIANRRQFDEKLQQEWNRLAREKKNLSLVLFDVDFFKSYNDNYGHQAGDLCLKTIAKIAASSVRRPADLVARYGGEEFALILPNTKIASAVLIVKKIQKLVQAAGIIHEFSKVSNLLTISFGISGVIPTHENSTDSLLLHADKALYAAKLKGRNQYECHKNK